MFFAAMIALSVGLWLACLAVMFHDVIVGLNFALNCMQLLTPVAYSITLIPVDWQFMYKLNPMTVVVSGFRWCILKTNYDFQLADWLSMLITITVLVLGAFHFRRTERTIVDKI
jgi:lipopolysaccharide transport system permease protein